MEIYTSARLAGVKRTGAVLAAPAGGALDADGRRARGNAADLGLAANQDVQSVVAGLGGGNVGITAAAAPKANRRTAENFVLTSGGGGADQKAAVFAEKTEQAADEVLAMAVCLEGLGSAW